MSPAALPAPHGGSFSLPLQRSQVDYRRSILRAACCRRQRDRRSPVRASPHPHGPQPSRNLHAIRWLADPDGTPVVSVQRLAAEAITALRQPGALLPAPEPAADFAHIVGVYTLAPACDV